MPHRHSRPDHDHDDTRIDQSLRYHTRQALSDIADHIEVMRHAVTALDTTMAEATAADCRERSKTPSPQRSKRPLNAGRCVGVKVWISRAQKGQRGCRVRREALVGCHGAMMRV